MSEQTETPRPRVLLALPSYGPTSPGTFRAAYLYASREAAVTRTEVRVSLLANCFNHAWCQAMTLYERGECSHFAMLHADVEPEPPPHNRPWIDGLLSEMRAHDADVVSAVVPIKDGRSILSTGIGRNDDPWHPLFRLTIKQALALPGTFSNADLGHPDEPLLVNTGCMLVRLGEWCHDFPGFTVRDRLRRVVEKDGQSRWVPEVEPEDWAASRDWHARGLKVMATTRVPVLHHGGAAFPSCDAYGDWGHDRDHDEAAALALSERLGLGE